MSDANVLESIEHLRSHPAYQGAEVLRRSTSGGAHALAKGNGGASGEAAVHLLISTWITIAVMVKAMTVKEEAYRVLPVCHMYKELYDAIHHLRNELPQNVALVEELNAEYDKWIRSSGLGSDYVTAACGGLHAKFG
jgi:hypothetical protein